MPPWYQSPAKSLNDTARAEAAARQDTLTKPPGSLGRLEALAIALAGMQGRARPLIRRPAITVFAGDHGVVAEGVAAFPQAVTLQMLGNFVAGGAAIAVLAREIGARLEVVDAGTLSPEPMPGVVWGKADYASGGLGTANFTQAAALSAADCASALDLGRATVARARAEGADLFIGGEMGIGNSTSAAALGCALLGLPGAALAGPGAGLDAAGVTRKAAVIDRGLAHHGFTPASAHADEAAQALRALACVGGYEIAALAGAYLACAQAGLPALVDGFITTAAALAACRINPGARDWLLFSHVSAEPGHARLLAALAAEPLLRLELRLGEGSGAAAAAALIRLACALHDGMATFAEAGVSGAG